MNTIHSSSLAHYPVAFSKPQLGRIDDSGKSTIGAGKVNPISQHSEFDARPSSTEQIKDALTKSGLPSENAYSLPNNTQKQKALNAYVQNYNQTAQRRVADMISGIDLYA